MLELGASKTPELPIPPVRHPLPLETPLLYTLSLVKAHTAAPRGNPGSQGVSGVRDVSLALSQAAETPVLDCECVEVHNYSGHGASVYHPELLSCGSKDHVC